MKALVVLAVFLCACSVALAAPAVFQDPASVHLTEDQLRDTCGVTRARVIGEMQYALMIHKDLLRVVTEAPAKGKTVGDAAWQRYWVDVYTRTISTLENDCSVP